MNRALLAVALGFVAGFLWGRGTREALPAATQTSFENGVFIVRVNAAQALSGGLSSLLG